MEINTFYVKIQKDINVQGKQILQRTRSFNTLKREFELADVLDYVKTGVEAIIEDQVTSRFEAEELKVNRLDKINKQ